MLSTQQSQGTAYAVPLDPVGNSLTPVLCTDSNVHTVYVQAPHGQCVTRAEKINLTIEELGDVMGDIGNPAKVGTSRVSVIVCLV